MSFDSLDVDEEILLTRVKPEDAEELFALVDGNRGYLREWMGWVDSTRSVDDIRTFLDESERLYDDGKGLQCCIRLREKIIGVIGSVYINLVQMRTELGYWVAEEHQRKGIASKATRALTEYAFTEWKLNRVELCIGVENTKSRTVAERLGFQLEGVFRERYWVNDHFNDQVVYSVLRREWRTDTIRQADEKGLSED